MFFIPDTKETMLFYILGINSDNFEICHISNLALSFIWFQF
jgi:hypothetical protein